MTGAANGSWIRRFHPAADQPVRVLLTPHAGGSASFYFPYSRALSARADVLAVQYPGRQDRMAEPLVDTVAGLADAISAALLPWLDRPVVLFGHSLGATVAYEVARRIEQGGVAPRGLVVSGRAAPRDIVDAGVHRGDDATLLATMAEMSGTDAEVLADPDLVSMILPVLRGDYHAAETYVYQPGPPLRCPVLALTGDADDRVSVAEADNWRHYTTGAFELEVFSGGHFYLIEHRAGVVDAISRMLAG